MAFKKYDLKYCTSYSNFMFFSNFHKKNLKEIYAYRRLEITSCDPWKINIKIFIHIYSCKMGAYKERNLNLKT